MSYPIFYPEENDVLPILWGTYAGSTGASITMTGLLVTDIEIYKDGGTTQRSSDAGYTLLDTDGIDFDSIVGIHGISINLADDTDAGFYSVGAWYDVVVTAVTIDGQTVSFVAGKFRIQSATRGMAGTALPDAAADAPGGLTISDAGGLDMDAMNAAAVRLTAARAQVLTDWIDGGRLDVLLDARALEATVNALNNLSTAQVNAECDTAIFDAALATAANLAVVDTIVDAILVDTDVTIPALIAALNDVSTAQVNVECDTAIADAALATAANLAVVDGIVDAILVDTDVTIPALIAALNDLSAAQVNAECDTAITDAALSTAANLAIIDTIVDAILVDTDITIPALIAALNDLSAAQVGAECDSSLIDYDGPTNADLNARTPLVGGRVDSNLGSIAGDAAAVLRFLASTQVIVRGTVDTVVNGHTPTITEFQADDITAGHPDHYIGRIILFRTGLLTFQATDIIDFVLVGGIAQFTVTALTRAPLDNEEFVIV